MRSFGLQGLMKFAKFTVSLKNSAFVLSSCNLNDINRMSESPLSPHNINLIIRHNLQSKETLVRKDSNFLLVNLHPAPNENRF